jgi:hypothetical protein
MAWPAEVIHAIHPEIEVSIYTPSKEADTGLRAYVDKDGTVTGAACPADADLLVFQRPSYWQMVKSIPHFREAGIAVIVDIDDDLAAIDPRNPAFTALHPEPHNLIPPPKGLRSKEELKRWKAHARQVYVDRSGHSWAAVKEAAALATMTTVSTPALAERYGNGNAVVLENRIPARFCEIPHEDSDVFGWPGSMHSHPGDLKVLGPAVAQLTRQGHRFLVVGDSTGADRELGMAEVPMTGPIPFSQWPFEVTKLGVGIAPLADTRFNAAKSALKVLELSAAGVPWVASPRQEYRSFVERYGVGSLAEKPKEWVRLLRRLLTDPVLRAEQSEAVREVARGLTIEGHAWRTAEVWTEAVDRERKRRPLVTAEGR